MVLIKKSYAIIHQVKCINPHDNEKFDGRELMKIKDVEKENKFG